MPLLVDNRSDEGRADMVVPTPEVADAVLLGMVRCALHGSPPGTLADESDDDVAGHLMHPAPEFDDTVAPGLAAVKACGRAVWAWRGVDQELGVLLCQSKTRRRRR